MLYLPSRGSVFALVLTAGFVGAVQTVPAQIAPATETAHTDAQGRHIAPHDTFYTLEYVSSRTDKGVEGFPPGTEVHLVSVNREAHTLTVSDGHANVELPPDKLTNDMDVAALVQAKDNANQERIAAFQHKRAEEYQKYLKAVADYTDKDLEKREKAISDANAREYEERSTNQPVQTTASANNNTNYNGYYNQGGYGYGEPFGYFVDVNTPAAQNNRTSTISTTNQTGGNRGTVSSSQSGNQVGTSRATGTATQSTGAASANSAGAGGKKP